MIAAPTPALREIFGPMPGADVLEIADTGHLAEAIRRQLHITPQIKDSDLVLEERRSITYRDFLVSTTVYDLEQAWKSGTPADEDSAIAQALEERFGPQRLVREVEAIYQKLGT